MCNAMVAMPACLGRAFWLVLGGAPSFALLRAQDCCSVPMTLSANKSIILVQAKIARDKYSAKDWVRPGKVLLDEGLRPKHPVVVVPGESVHP